MRRQRWLYFILIVCGAVGLAVGLVQAAAYDGETAVSPTPTNAFPAAAETYKIEVNQDGIYEISGADLAAAGMNIASVDPATIQMMVRNQAIPTQTLSVATQFVGDGDAVLESNEIIRFYGWAFDGSRHEKQFVTNNVFWLWAGGTANDIAPATNPTGGTAVNSTMTSVTREPETYFTTTYSDQWDTFPNEADGWYWDYLSLPTGSTGPLTRTYAITLPHPAASGPDAVVTAEMMPYDKSYYYDPANRIYTIKSYINSYASYGEQTWVGRQNVNVTNSVPLAELQNQSNDVRLAFTADSSTASVFLNRITVDYLRQLVADDDQLIFSDETGGLREFQVSGFSGNNPTDTLVWNISDRANPQQMDMNGRISGSGPYTYLIGSDTNDTQFIATTTAHTLTPAAISQYIPADLEPPGGGADWIAISHADFIAQANVLATHRASFSSLQTWVVDIEDVTNQYGFGLPIPAAMHDYLQHAYEDWTPTPGYVTLFGSATVNPRNLDCPYVTCPGNDSTITRWDANQPTFIVTDLVFEDRIQGLIPTDHTLVLFDNDLLPDMAIGRITANTASEAEAAVSKIILYEQNQLTGASWQNNILFVADDGEGFSDANAVTANNHVPNKYAVTHLNLPDDSITATNNLRDALRDEINGPGASIVNYRGHGSVDGWASPRIISTDSASTEIWTNVLNPTVILSADCLDGNFAIPGLPALSQTLLTLRQANPVGTAAHWSSTGLGFTFEHSILHRGFYDGLFVENLLTIGDAVNYAKESYYNSFVYHDSEMYGFLLQGDPAMQMFTLRYEVYLPTILNP